MLDDSDRFKEEWKASRPKPPKQKRPSPSPDDDDGDISAESSGDETVFKDLDLGALEHRGRGEYRCPKTRCKRGGVDRDGQLVIFTRNSAYLFVPIPSHHAAAELTNTDDSQHVNKHRKPYVCNKLGCPNTERKRRFARKDGLDRHQKTVDHYDSIPTDRRGSAALKTETTSEQVKQESAH